MNNKIKEPEKGILTQRMDTKSSDFDKFQAKLLNKSKESSREQKLNIELLALRYKIEEYLQKEETDDLKTAGEFIRQYLKVLQIKQSKFASYIGIKPSNLSKLLKGERPINYDLALIFGKLFNTDPMLWVDIQAKNELLRLKKVRSEKYHNYSLSDLINQS